MGSRSVTLLRAVGVWTLATLLAATGLWWLWGELSGAVTAVRDGQAHDARLDQLVVWTAAAAATLALGWLWVMTTAVIVTASGGRPARPVPGCPDWLRRAILAGCGLALVSGLGSPALAEDHRPDPPGLSGLSLPDRAHVQPWADLPAREPTGQPPTGSRRRDHDRTETHPATVRVRPGDSLWRIASTLLPDGATDREVARLASSLHRANHDVIGPDPDLILPEQRLHVPADPTRGSRP